MDGYVDGDTITDNVYIKTPEPFDISKWQEYENKYSISDYTTFRLKESGVEIPSKLSENNHMIDYGGKYVCLCKSCNNYFVKGRDDYLTCPHCGGVYSQILGDKIVDNTDATVVVGSYMLDLYFR